jgi:serine/threonine-protein kinase
VLYFDVTGGDAELTPVAAGLTDGLIQALRQAKLDVVSRNGVAPFQGTSTPTDSIARALGVGTVIRGTVMPEGPDRVRITTWLTDADGNDLGRRSNFMVSRDSLFAAQEAVATTAATRLREQLGLEFRLAETRAGTANAAAWTLFQRGEKLRKDAEAAAAENPGDARRLLAQSDSLLRLAGDADPRWVTPLISRGEVALMSARLEPEAAERIRQIEAGSALTEQALRLDPANGVALALRGTLNFAKYRLTNPADRAVRDVLLQSAETDLQNAVTTDPSLATAYATLTSIQYEKKDVFSAFTMARNAYIADAYLSNADNILASLSDAAYDTEQFAESARWCEEGGRRFPDDYRFTLCRLWMMITPDARPDIDEAWRLAARVDSLAPPASRDLLSRLGRMIVAGAIGKRVGSTPNPMVDSARQVLVRARADASIDPERELPGFEAIMRTQIGDVDEAISLLKQYVAVNPDHSFMVGGNVHWWWRDLRDNPGFQAVLAQRR